MNINKFFSYLCLYFLIMDPAIYPLKLFGGAPWALSILIILYLYNKEKSDGIPLFKYKPEVTIFFAIFTYVSIRTLFTGVIDLSFLNSLIRTSISLLATILYLNVFGCEHVIKRISNLLILCGIWALLAVNIPEFMSFTMMLKPIGNVFDIDGYYNPFRIAFPSYNSFFGIAVIYGLMLVFWSVHIAKKSKVSIKDYLIFVFILIFGVLAGRVVLIALTLSFIIIFIYKKKLAVYIISIVLSVIFIVINYNLVDEKIINWISLVLPFTDHSQSHSLSELNSMYTFKDNVNYWFGDGIFKVGEQYYQNVDVGFLRKLYFGGSILLILTSVYTFVIFRPLKSTYIISILIISIIFELKGIVLINNASYGAMIIILASYIRYSREYNNE